MEKEHTDFLVDASESRHVADGVLSPGDAEVGEVEGEAVAQVHHHAGTAFWS